MTRTHTFRHRHKTVEFRITEDGTLQLWLDGVMRKDRRPGADPVQYVWTNVELEWEEHHYIEARFWPAEDRLVISVNREAVQETTI